MVDLSVPPRGDAALPGTSAGLSGYLARPSGQRQGEGPGQGEGPWPGVVVLHEAFGVDDVMRRATDRMAAMGYLAVLPDLFSQGRRLPCLVSTFRAMATGTGRAFADIEATRRWLLGQPDCSGGVGVLGFCLGGGFALLVAKRGFDVAAVNYGALPRNLDAALDGACPVVASYGGRDRTLRGAAHRLTQALAAAGIEHDVQEYPAAGHSFLNDAPAGPRALRPVSGWLMGAGPHLDSAADAWQRIDAFFRAHLRPADHPDQTPGTP